MRLIQMVDTYIDKGIHILMLLLSYRRLCEESDLLPGGDCDARDPGSKDGSGPH